MLLLALSIIVLLVTACQVAASERTNSTTFEPVAATGILPASSMSVASVTPQIVLPPSPSATIKSTPTVPPTPSPTASPSYTATGLPSSTATASITPTYSILRGTVKEQSNCRYGPGAAYLYKYGLYAENTLQVIGRNDSGTWILVQAIGGNNPCWLKASLMEIKGNVMDLAPATLPLPQSPYYGPLTGVASQRAGDSVTISWNQLSLKAGDDSLQYPYLVEAWLCQDGKLIFSPIGSWETVVTVTDEPGCSEASHARVYGVEKHGYTRWVEVPWTQP